MFRNGQAGVCGNSSDLDARIPSSNWRHSEDGRNESAARSRHVEFLRLEPTPVVDFPPQTMEDYEDGAEHPMHFRYPGYPDGIWDANAAPYNASGLRSELPATNPLLLGMQPRAKGARPPPEAWQAPPMVARAQRMQLGAVGSTTPASSFTNKPPPAEGAAMSSIGPAGTWCVSSSSGSRGLRSRGAPIHSAGQHAPHGDFAPFDMRRGQAPDSNMRVAAESSRQGLHPSMPPGAWAHASGHTQPGSWARGLAEHTGRSGFSSQLFNKRDCDIVSKGKGQGKGKGKGNAGFSESGVLVSKGKGKGNAGFSESGAPEALPPTLSCGQAGEQPPQNPAQSSLGSEGHPLCCQLPCKYIKSQRGCKEGEACTFCHICQWWRGLRSAKGKALEIARRSERAQNVPG